MSKKKDPRMGTRSRVVEELEIIQRLGASADIESAMMVVDSYVQSELATAHAWLKAEAEDVDFVRSLRDQLASTKQWGEESYALYEETLVRLQVAEGLVEPTPPKRVTGMEPLTCNLRAEWARDAVELHMRETGGDEDLETGILDMICNLAHLADASGLNPVDLIRKGLYHHAAERQCPPDDSHLEAEASPTYASSPHAELFGLRGPGTFGARARATLLAALVHWRSVENKDEMPERGYERAAGGGASAEVLEQMLAELGFDEDEYAAFEAKVAADEKAFDAAMRTT